MVCQLRHKSKQAMASRSLVVPSAALCVAIAFSLRYVKRRYWDGKGLKRPSPRSSVVCGFEGLIGDTPMVRIASLSRATGCEILAKCEYLNPGGSSKDRIAKHLVIRAENMGLLKPGGTIVEGTSGSTGISLAQVARSRGYDCIIVMPNDQAQEKRDTLQRLGAKLHLVPPSSTVSSEHYIQVAKQLANSIPGGCFIDQFDNPGNAETHLSTTGPEIWGQVRGALDAFVMSAGTGGTIAGVGRFLKSKSQGVQVVLADPQGSSLYHKVNDGVLYAPQQAERGLRRHRKDTITEGIGMDRLTYNFKLGLDYIDRALRVSDQEVVDMAAHLLQNDGLFLGSSSALNLCAAVKVARQLGPGHTIVTIICGGGARELSKLYNPEYLRSRGLSYESFGASM